MDLPNSTQSQAGDNPQVLGLLNALHGAIAEARPAGKVRIEGKEYVMADGDVVEFRFNV